MQIAFVLLATLLSSLMPARGTNTALVPAAQGECVAEMRAHALPGCHQLCVTPTADCVYVMPDVCVSIATRGRCLTPRSAATYWCLVEVKGAQRCKSLCLQYTRSFPNLHPDCLTHSFLAISRCVAFNDHSCWVTFPYLSPAPKRGISLLLE
eukprot:Gregarina_sp_Pseudo_9__1151@NODE_1758_length_1350_cov_42_540046_g1630_i0_p2_GENE_NODE_1758_length_1350_cov_42_540046_g1630_i0NODE_1758_length_1350_cov_42_540046_g1630_i0_p2_ORF_typecomplete_len152_score28_95_NODE_1758_length_1350_cov_42_540046_g1630_i08931348